MLEFSLFCLLFCAVGVAAGLTGAGYPKWIRRDATPGFIALLGLLILMNWNAIGLLLRAIPQHMGYGMPDKDDAGSFLGRFWTNNFPKPTTVEDARKAQILTRGSVGLIDGLACVIIPFIAGTAGAWALYLWVVVALVLINVIPPVLFPHMGQIEVKGIKLNWHEIIIAGASSVVIIKLLLLVR